jgi:hypothetical protein
MLETADARSGLTVELRDRTGECIYGPNENVLMVLSSGKSYLICHRGVEVLVPKLTFALLDAAFSATSVCITESGGPVRCIDCLTGDELWRHTPPVDSHALRLHYNRADGFFYGVVWHYEKGQFRHLVRFDSETGQNTLVRALDSWEEEFSEATQRLVTAGGDIIDLAGGDIVGKLAFPLIEYPDRRT